MKEINPTSIDVLRFLEDSLTNEYWSSEYNPGPRLSPEENEAVVGSKQPLPGSQEISADAEAFLQENHTSSELAVDVQQLVRNEFGVDFQSYSVVKTSENRSSYFWLCLSNDNILDIFSYSPKEKKFLAFRKASKADIYLYLQQDVPQEIQLIFMHIDKTTFDNAESLAKCLAAWMGIGIEQSREVVTNASNATVCEVMFAHSSQL